MLLCQGFATHCVDWSENSLAHLSHCVVDLEPIGRRMDLDFSGLVDGLLGGLPLHSLDIIASRIVSLAR